MPACPRCHAPALDRGFCAQCGFHDPRLAPPEPPPAAPRVITGTPAAPPQYAPPPPSAPAPVEVFEGSSVDLPGFEPTSFTAPTAAPEAPAPAADFVYETCPRCRHPQPDPPETFCPHCSYRVLVRKRRGAATTDRVKRCAECGTPNDPARHSCVNCGFRLASDD